MGLISGEVNNVTHRLGSLDDQINDLHGNQQRLSTRLLSIDEKINVLGTNQSELPTMKDIERSMRSILLKPSRKASRDSGDKDDGESPRGGA